MVYLQKINIIQIRRDLLQVLVIPARFLYLQKTLMPLQLNQVIKTRFQSLRVYQQQGIHSQPSSSFREFKYSTLSLIRDNLTTKCRYMSQKIDGLIRKQRFSGLSTLKSTLNAAKQPNTVSLSLTGMILMYPSSLSSLQRHTILLFSVSLPI